MIYDIKKAYVITARILFLFLIPTSANAVEPIIYKEKPTPYVSVNVSSFLEKTYETNINDYIIAEIDLNNDGDKEFILKRKFCANTPNPCIHLILAKVKEDIILLSNITAKNLMIAGTKTFGIKDILAFTDEINQYDFDIYIWSPSEKKYIIEKS